MMPITESVPIFTIGSIQVAEFTVEDVKIQSLNGGIKKKFTSQASSYSVVFKWDFGDNTTYSGPNRTVIHEYSHPGTYTVKHQACLLDLPCCYSNNIPWCVKVINVKQVTEAGIIPLLGFGLLFGMLFKKECEDYKNKKDCDKHQDSCQWIEERKKCVKKEKRGVPIIPAKVSIPPTKEEKARLMRPEPILKKFNAEDLFLIAELRKRGAKGIPVCTGDQCRIGKWIAIAEKKGKPPIIIHDP